METQTCKCGKTHPLTEEFWHRNRHLKSGFATNMCKKCRREYCSDRAHGYRRTKKRKATLEAIQSLNTLEQEHFGSFEARALRERMARLEGQGISIYQEI